MENNNTPPPHEPILCPRCRSNNLAFITEYHKEIKGRIVQLLLFIYFAIAAVYSIRDDFDDFPVVALILIIVLHVAINASESKTHVQCICKDCGRTWLHT